ncbi:MAG TPA: sigma-70 family RNA polymerase sigma factor, partial [Candidatus Paceibacterota bacterium]|nr:sigma-70 family RNA polymerase sigma factor [Candidatus Paceibacterota bacterium]
KHKNEQNILGLNQNFDIVDDKETSTEEQIVNKETVSEIREQISKLPKKYQEVVMLADIKGLDCKEIADLLNIPIGTVKSRLHRGQAMLQERMQNKNNRSIK